MFYTDIAYLWFHCLQSFCCESKSPGQVVYSVAVFWNIWWILSDSGVPLFLRCFLMVMVWNLNSFHSFHPESSTAFTDTCPFQLSVNSKAKSSFIFYRHFLVTAIEKLSKYRDTYTSLCIFSHVFSVTSAWNSLY